eukprot:m.1140539 g.1140539  ORF g.1140539 m.1140539 type:complete len:359 (-) comp24446_c0_seq10:2234-3310(-)
MKKSGLTINNSAYVTGNSRAPACMFLCNETMRVAREVTATVHIICTDVALQVASDPNASAVRMDIKQDRAGVVNRLKHSIFDFKRHTPLVVTDMAQFCMFSKYVDLLDVPVGMVMHLNENWGGVSAAIDSQTATWGHVAKDMQRNGCTMASLRRFMNKPNVRLIYTTQHQSPPLSHIKLWSLPLGTRKAAPVLSELQLASTQTPGLRNRTLFITLSDYAFRKTIKSNVILNNDGMFKDEFGKFRGADFQREIRLSKFVLIAPGMGWDTYRFWETLYSGAIPVVLKSTAAGGLLRSYGYAPNGLHRLPVLWVDSMEEITEDLLLRSYEAILSRCDDYDYEMLTTSYWVRKMHDEVSRPM